MPAGSRRRHIIGDGIGNAARAAVGHDGARAVGRAKDQALLIEILRTRRWRPFRWRQPSHRRRIEETRLGDGLRHRLALGVIRVEQSRVGLPVRTAASFQREIVHILDAGVEAEPPVGGIS